MRRSLARILTVLEAIAEQEQAVSLTTLSEQVALPTSTVSRIVASLIEAGYVRKDSYRLFRADMRLIQLGMRVLDRFDLPHFANPEVYAVANRLDVRGVLAGLCDHQVVYLYDGGRQLRPDLVSPQTRYPLHHSHPGQVILAHSGLPDDVVRERLVKSVSISAEDDAVVEQALARQSEIREAGYLAAHVAGGRYFNVAFPIYHQDAVYSVALVGPAEDDEADQRLILECSLLAGRIHNAIRKAS